MSVPLSGDGSAIRSQEIPFSYTREDECPILTLIGRRYALGGRT